MDVIFLSMFARFQGYLQRPSFSRKAAPVEMKKRINQGEKEDDNN